MRLFLLPISTRRTLIYCEPLSHAVPTAKQSYLDRAVNKGNEIWLGFEKDTKAPFNWKRRVTDYGNVLFRRIPFEEWGLKSIPPIKAAAAAAESSPDGKPVSGAKALQRTRVEVRFPGLYQDLCSRTMSDTLSHIATGRQALHRKRMIQSICALPIALPFGLLPVIPNLPFFYAAFRAYSHWKALNGSRHLEDLIKQNLLSLKADPALDTLYTAGLLHPTPESSRGATQPTLEQSCAVVQQLKLQSTPLSSRASSIDSNAATEKSRPQSSPDDGEEVMLLRAWNGKVIAERLGLPGLQVEIERAVEQVEGSIGKSPADLDRNKREIEQLALRAEQGGSGGAKMPAK